MKSMHPHRIFSKSRFYKSDGENMTVRRESRSFERFMNRRKTLSGFPITDGFKTLEEVKDYVTGPDIQCLLCGKVFRMLATHLVRIHNVSVDEYKEFYGIPWTYSLACSEVSEICARNSKKRIKKGDLDMKEIWKKASRKSRQRKAPECIKALMRERYEGSALQTFNGG